ncbi:helix-turn-helix domain-containing protein [Nonomuraea montanisoli]|uniref:helix-turn-helix domain-containing protein n=1 Tax=Nonomuraea montanisoli TaxID=2741721 RepID=UPI002E2E0B78|nr:helix-turn-helix domain-containing protein [Nonomuraea montanisoli]
MLTGRRYRLELTVEQAAYAERVAGMCRMVWNTALEQRHAYRRRGASIGYAAQCAQLVEAKAEFAWLSEAPAHVLQQALKDLDQAIRIHGTWKVRWRSARRWKPSFRFPSPERPVVREFPCRRRTEHATSPSWSRGGDRQGDQGGRHDQ